MRYIVGRYHKIGAREFQEGEILEIDDPVYAAWLNRDMRGYLREIVPAVAVPVIETHMVEMPGPQVETRKSRDRRKRD